MHQVIRRPATGLCYRCRWLQSRLRQFSARAPRQAGKQDGDGDADEPPIVRYFEKDIDSDAAPVPVKGNVNPGLLEAQALSDQGGQLLKDLHGIDAIQNLERGLKTGLAIFDRLSAKEKRKVAVAFRERKQEMEGLKIKMGGEISRETVAQVKLLNNALKRVRESDDKDWKGNKLLWQRYINARAVNREVLKHLPDAAWDLLWESQTTFSDKNPSAASHTQILVADMMQAGRAPTLPQTIAQIEALFVSDRQEAAIDKWEEVLKSFDEEFGGKVAAEYLDVGLRMYSEIGDISRARHILQGLLEYEDMSPRSILPLLGAHIEAGTEDDMKQAWALYTMLKDYLGSNIEMEDYDSVYLAFLEAKQRDFALAVFRDMMLSNVDRTESRAMSQVSHQEVIDAGSLGRDAGSLNNISLTALSLLPARFQNKYFFGSWMKKLIGMEEVGAAEEVVELMFERGIRPDAIHLNGFISALFRTGTDENKDKAEHIGGLMIQSRLAYVERRRHSSRREMARDMELQGMDTDFLRPTKTPPDMRPQFLQRRMPPATPETMCILLHHFLREKEYNVVQRLKSLLREAELPMTAKFMNHMLWSYHFVKQPRSAWGEFLKLSQEVTPSTESFVCLWKCLRTHLESPDFDQARDAFPSPRALFARMLKWLSSLDEPQRERAIAAFNHEGSQRGAQQSETDDIDGARSPYEAVLAAFCIDMDGPGTELAIRGLQTHLHAFPDGRTARKVVQQVARSPLPVMRMAPHRGGGRRRRRERERAMGRSAEVKQNGERVSALLREMFERRRVHMMEVEGVDPDALDDEAKDRLNADLLCQLVRVPLLRRYSGEDVRGMLERAAAAMGLGEMVAVVMPPVVIAEGTATTTSSSSTTYHGG